MALSQRGRKFFQLRTAPEEKFSTIENRARTQDLPSFLCRVSSAGN